MESNVSEGKFTIIRRSALMLVYQFRFMELECRSPVVAFVRILNVPEYKYKHNANFF